MSWSRNKYGHSSQFLAGPIHSVVYQQYYSDIAKNNFKQDSIKAKKLQEYLYDIKNYIQKQQQGEKTLFTQAEYSLFINTYNSVRNLQGINTSNIFRHSGGTYFEKELADTQISLKSIFEKQTLTNKLIQQYKGQIILGQDKTKINFPMEEILKDTTQSLLKQLGVKTTQYLNKEAKKKKDISQKVTVIKDVQPKIDLKTNSIQIDYDLALDFPNLAAFAKLFANSTITAKNYPKIVIEKFTGGVSLGNTQIFRILADFLPTLKLGLTRSEEISFQYAIFNRKLGHVKTKIAADDQIQTHFNHIQNIYELMGVGQNYYKNEIINELNTLLKQGANFLIYNESDTNKIIVKSTKELLYLIYQNNLQNNRENSILTKIEYGFLQN